MSDKIFKLTVLCTAFALGGLSAGQTLAGAASVGTTPVFIPPIVTTPPPGCNPN